MGAVAEDAEIAETEAIEETATPEVDNNLGELPEVADNRSLVVQSILISLTVNGGGAVCISDGGGVHFSVRNRPPVRGRTSTPQNRNETVTSSARSIINY